MTNKKLSPEPMSQEEDKLRARRAAIADQIFDLIECRQAYRRQNNIELGRKYIEAKNTFTEHGEWTRFYKETFESKTGISLNRAQRYMRLARHTDQKMEVPLFEPATDTEAREVQDAAKASKKEVDQKQRLVLHLVLHLAREEDKNTLVRLCRSPQWPFVERKLINLLKRLYAETKNEDLRSAA